MENFFSLAKVPGAAGSEEFFETLLRGEGGLRIERIVSQGHVTPADTWYDQEQDEWVMVARGSARILYEDGSELSLEAGDHALLPKGRKHRVSYTSSPCIWLAVFADTLIEGAPAQGEA